MDGPVAYRIIRSARKTMALQISPEGQLLVRCPLRATDQQIDRFVDDHRGWIEKHLSKRVAESTLPPLTAAEIRSLADRAVTVIPERVRHFAPLVGVRYGRITIRNQISRWGSCTSTGNLNFNCLLMLTPPEVLDYVVVHELCHRLEMNHSQKFWAQVQRVLPDYKTYRKWLKDNGPALIRRMQKGK